MRWLTRILLLSSTVAFSTVSLLCADDRVPVLSADLRTLGYLPPVADRDVRYYYFLRGAVTFLDNQTLAVSFFKKNEHPGLSRRDGSPGSAVVFHTVFFDPATGACATNELGEMPQIRLRFRPSMTEASSSRMENG